MSSLERRWAVKIMGISNITEKDWRCIHLSSYVHVTGRDHSSYRNYNSAGEITYLYGSKQYKVIVHVPNECQAVKISSKKLALDQKESQYIII